MKTVLVLDGRHSIEAAAALEAAGFSVQTALDVRDERITPFLSPLTGLVCHECLQLDAWCGKCQPAPGEGERPERLSARS
jgi:hypothetical protein